MGRQRVGMTEETQARTHIPKVINATTTADSLAVYKHTKATH